MNQILSRSEFELFIHKLSLEVFIIGLAFLLVGFLYLVHHKYNYRASMLFAFAAGAATVFAVLAIGAVSLLVQSDSFGHKHRQSGVEFWVCDTEIKLRYKRPSTGEFYLDEHKHVYYSGFILNEKTEATLPQFMQDIGGDIQLDSIAIPLEKAESAWLTPPQQQDGDPQGSMSTEFFERFVRQGESRLPVAELSSGQTCPDGESAELQTFVYRKNVGENSYYQEKLDHPEDYIFSQATTVPPGDCVIVEFTKPKERTNKLCRSYGIQDSRRCSAFGAKNIDDSACNLHEMHASGESL